MGITTTLINEYDNFEILNIAKLLHKINLLVYTYKVNAIFIKLYNL